MGNLQYGELEALIAEARARFAALSSDDQRAHMREQRISWVRGQIGLMTGREMPSYEEIAKLVDERDARRP